MHSSSPSIFCASCLSKLDHLSNPPISESSQTISSHVRNGFNLPFSPKEIAQIDSFLDDASESLSECDNAVAEIEGLLIRLKNSRDRLQRRCDSARYLISAPIRRLPLDVLHEIFMLFCDMDAPHEAHYGASDVYTLYMSKEISCPTLKLTWVCSFWRTFVQSCPNLWSSITVSATAFESRPEPFQILVKYLSHSADSLLDFSFNARSASNPMVQEAIELFLGCSTRWRQAVLWVPYFFTAVAGLSIKSLGSFPALESLDIMAPGLLDQELFFQKFSLCPRLRVVALWSFSWSGHNADFSSITNLTLCQFIGKSFGHLLRRLPVLESLSVVVFKLSEDGVDDGCPRPEMGNYRSSLRKLTASYSVFQPVAWRSIRLPHLTDMTLSLNERLPSQNLLFLSSVLHDSQCQLNAFQLHDNYDQNLQSQRAVLDFIASQNSLTHLAIYTRDVDPFVELLKSKEDGSYVIHDLRSLQLNATVTTYGFRALALSICEMIESRCTVLYSPNGNREISGLQALTLNLDCHTPEISAFVHNRLSLLKVAGFKLFLK